MLVSFGLLCWHRDRLVGEKDGTVGLDATATRLMWAFADSDSRRELIEQCVSLRVLVKWACVCRDRALHTTPLCCSRAGGMELLVHFLIRHTVQVDAVVRVACTMLSC